MAPVYGRNGFSDCRMLCDPRNGYSQKTCEKECEGIYSYKSTTTDTIISSSSTLTSTLSSIIVEVFTTIQPIPSSEGGTSGMVYNIIGSIFLFCAMLLFLGIFFRQRLFAKLQSLVEWTRNKICQISNGRERDGVEMENLKDESKVFLSNHKSNDTDETRRQDADNENDSEINALKPNCQKSESAQLTLKSGTDIQVNIPRVNSQIENASGVKHYADSEYRTIRHDSFEYPSESKSESDNDSDTDSESGSKHSDSPSNGADQMVKNKKKIRITTEINLR